MKKAIAITALVTVMGLTGMNQAIANWGPGGMGGPGGCGGAGMQARAEMDDATKAKFDTFLTDNQATRKEIMIKQAEKRALMHAENPDAKQVSQLTGEIFDLRATMHAKAKEAGLEKYMGMGQGCGNCDGPRGHHGRKGMMRGERPSSN
ncbi:MAG: periplasmic heavy metal sensor [Desulfocapsa sp.]|nr:periplasmic heavy metal sensor [Desulfocapsa sp.]